MRRVPAYVFIVVATVGAGSSTACSDPVCVRAIEVVNESVTNQSYEVVIDDEIVGTLSPGESRSYEQTSSSHSVQINFAAGGVACDRISLLLRECQSSLVVCEA
jgi:hypothetical protein